MKRHLVRTGNSVALVITKEMREHLGLTDSVDVQFVEGQIVLRKPMSLEEASDASDKKFKSAYERLAK